MSIIWVFHHIENKHTSYRGKDCMRNFCESLREHTMLPFTKEELKSHLDAKARYICGKRILKNLSKSMNYQKVRDHCHYTGKYRSAAHICSLKLNVPNDIHGSNYDYHFIIQELANEFKGKFECLGENAVKCKIFSVPIEKEVTEIDKFGNESFASTSYKIKFIDSARFMAPSLSSFVDNVTEGIHIIKCKDCDFFLE